MVIGLHMYYWKVIQQLWGPNGRRFWRFWGAHVWRPMRAMTQGRQGGLGGAAHMLMSRPDCSAIWAVAMCCWVTGLGAWVRTEV